MRSEFRTLADDNRALAVNIALFFGTIIIGFLLAMVLQPGAEQMLEIAGEQTSRESSQQGQQYVQLAFSNLHLLVVGFGVLQLVVAAVYESKVGGVPR